MGSPQRRLAVLFSLFYWLISPSLAQNAATETQTLISQDIFSSQKPCAQGCFLGDFAGCGIDGVASAIGCNYNYCGNTVGATNGCYCRTDLQSVAVSYVSSCVKSKCTIGDSDIDISSAVSIYDSYCVANGFPVNVAATPTQAAKSTTGASPASTAANPASTQTSSGSNNNINGGNTVNVDVGKGAASSLSNPGKIAVGVTIPLVVAAVAVFCWYMIRRRRTQRRVPSSRNQVDDTADERKNRSAEFKFELGMREELSDDVVMDRMKVRVGERVAEVPDSSVPRRHIPPPLSGAVPEISGHSVYELHSNS